MYKLHREAHSRCKIEDGLIYRGLTVNLNVQINENSWGYIVFFFLLICLNIWFEWGGGAFVMIVYQVINRLISQPKHMFWVLKRTATMRRFF